MSGMLALMGDGRSSGGGISRYNADWLDALAPQPVHALFRQLDADATSATSALRGGEVAVAAGRFAYVRAAFKLARQVRPEQVFCSHLHFAPLARWLCRRFGARLWLQLHGIEAWPVPSRTRRHAAETADLVTCVSRYTRGRFLSWSRIAPERVRVLPNTVGAQFQPAAVDPALAARLGLHGQPLLLSVGRLSASEAYKGQDRVIRCMPALLQKYPELVYAIAGDGDDRPRLSELAQRCGVAPQVRFLGVVEPSQLADLYRLADLYVMPSQGEGFGIVYLEAMACGTPALGLAGDGSVDPLLDGQLGSLCASASDAALTDAVLEALAQPRDRAGLANAVQQHFGSVRFSAQVRHLAQALASAGQAPIHFDLTAATTP